MATAVVVLVIDGTIEHRIDITSLVDAAASWEAQIAALTREVQGWITRSDVTALPLEGGGQVLVSWRAIKTVEIRQ
ncbi:hypothetical protein I6A84_17645 [Frankia sp. CNm7]|uniref:Uncharacterized protein n=1 Tax=Frankia nepalensis TaxID=1836974 RepID=A0A937RIH7_9ACTN|nr:hypothetical protein [Frankia nepalensis]MBL7494874.1 hypothetical protein [Frankia nepalensis]MBL7514420.1 hypothetical protein [Frankia nepalensis]MBL7519869.1 hypothetical protein [Frankia nepalensis]MBL7632868.1 hypothetical protein [Frankia nepalensis]